VASFFGLSGPFWSKTRLISALRLAERTDVAFSASVHPKFDSDQICASLENPLAAQFAWSAAATARFGRGDGAQLFTTWIFDIGEVVSRDSS
jgi:hypothetical protein